MPVKFELKQSKSGKFTWNLVASNGEVILTSQQYTSRSGAKKGIASVQSCAASGDRYERRKSRNGKDYFVLKAGNHRVVGHSEQYNSTRGMENGIKSVQKNARRAAIKDA